MILVHENRVVNLGNAELVTVTTRGDSETIVVRTVVSYTHGAVNLDLTVRFDGVSVNREITEKIERQIAMDISLVMSNIDAVVPYYILVSTALMSVIGKCIEINYTSKVLLVRKKLSK